MIALRHFLMDDPAARGHPLYIASGNGAAVPHAVAVIHGSREDVCNGFDSTVRVPGEPCQIIFRNVIPKIIEEKKGIEIGSVAEAERTSQMHSRAFQRRLRGDHSFYRSERHGQSLLRTQNASDPAHKTVARFNRVIASPGHKGYSFVD